MKAVYKNVHRMIAKRKRVVKRVVKTTIPINQLGIQIPQIDYKVIADISMKKVYTGRVTPMPTPLIYYLRPVELLFIATIINEIVEHGECTLTSAEFMLRIGISAPTLYNTKSTLRKMGLIEEERLNNKRFRYCINWKAVNNLENLTVNKPSAIMIQVRKATTKKILENLTSTDIDKSYSEKVLPYDHDPREEEMYD